MDGGNPSFPSTTSLVPLSHKAVPSGHAVITHFTALILITANVNIRIININAQNNAVICNYRVALIFLPSPPFPSFCPPPLLSPLQCNHAIVLLWTDLIRLLYINICSRQALAEYYRGDFHKFQCRDERVWVFSLEGGETRTKQEDFIVVNRRARRSLHTITFFFFFFNVVSPFEDLVVGVNMWKRVIWGRSFNEMRIMYFTVYWSPVEPQCPALNPAKGPCFISPSPPVISPLLLSNKA